MNQISLSFKKSNDSELAKEGNNILASIKGNASFTDTTQEQALEKSLTEFQVALNNAADGGKTFISIKRDKRKVLIETLIKVALYVTQVCNGDRSMLLSSGFQLRKEKGVARTLSAIENFVVTSDKPGEASIRLNKVAGARAYVHQYSADPPSATTVWVSETTAHRKHTFTGLKQYAVYYFRVIAIGLNGQSVISDPIIRVIQ